MQQWEARHMCACVPKRSSSWPSPSSSARIHWTITPCSELPSHECAGGRCALPLNEAYVTGLLGTADSRTSPSSKIDRLSLYSRMSPSSGSAVLQRR
jgi:hypothetical protein